jgi:hypothetical protein
MICSKRSPIGNRRVVWTLTALLSFVGLNAMAGDSTATVPPPLPTAPDTHRALRGNAPADMPEPTEPKPFDGYPGAPPFTVVPQKDKLTWFLPCSTCHAALPLNPVPRKLNVPHNATLVHGNGRFWCLECHQLKDRDHLHTLTGQSVDFNDAYLVCGQCHFNRQKDWYFGAHGKRVGNWKGQRVIYNCTHCHDPHSPSLKPRAPEAPPPVRAGLKPMPAWAAAAGSAGSGAGYPKTTIEGRAP